MTNEGRSKAIDRLEGRSKAIDKLLEAYSVSELRKIESGAGGIARRTNLGKCDGKKEKENLES
jgi:hypothetical protein